MSNIAENLKTTLNDFQNELQANADAIVDLMEQREILHKAPAHERDVARRMKEVITEMSTRYIRTHAADIKRLTGSHELTDNVELFSKTTHLDGSPFQLMDPDALAFFNLDHLLTATESIAEDITEPDAGLPREEREKKIAEIDAQITKLEEVNQGLYQQAEAAGLVVTEEYVDL